MGIFDKVFSLLILLTVISCNQNSPGSKVAVNGVAELSQYDFADRGPINLNGEWRWKPNSIEPEYIASGLPQSAELFTLPGHWKKKLGSIDGHATFTLELNLPEAGLYGISISEIANSYALYINGQKLMQNGRVSDNPVEHLGELKRSFRLIRLEKSNLLTLQISSYNFITGGPSVAPRIGLPHDIRSEFISMIIHYSAIMGICTVIGIIYFGIWFYRRSEKMYLWFSILCTITALRILITENTANYLFHETDIWLLASIIALGTFYICAGIIVKYIQSIIPKIWPRQVTTAIFYIAVGAGLLTFVLPLSISFLLIKPFFIFVIMISLSFTVRFLMLLNRLTLETTICGAGIVVIYLAFMHDMLTIWGYNLLGFNIGPFGVLAFIITNSIILGRDLAHSYNTTERLQANLAMEVKSQTDQLKKANDLLMNLSYVDPLTGISNRRLFDEALLTEWVRCYGEKKDDLGMLLIDIDYFKDYNDTYGHVKGDEALEKVADTLKSCIRRSGDIISRYGGEEFAIILPGADATGVMNIAEKMRLKVEELHIEHSKSKCSDYLTISCGVTHFQLNRHEGIPCGHIDFLEQADNALYKAKENGRNQVVFYEGCGQSAPTEQSNSNLSEQHNN